MQVRIVPVISRADCEQNPREGLPARSDMSAFEEQVLGEQAEVAHGAPRVCLGCEWVNAAAAFNVPAVRMVVQIVDEVNTPTGGEDVVA